MKKLSQLILLICLPIAGHTQISNMKTISKNGMSINYKYDQDSLFFEVSAPTSGWITIGFNKQQDLKGSLLIMCRVVNGKAEVVEHYTLGAGNYRPITELGGINASTRVKSSKRKGITIISFHTPSSPVDKYHKDLSEGNEFYITLAYSQSVDFQHHSIMRTNVKSIL